MISGEIGWCFRNFVLVLWMWKKWRIINFGIWIIRCLLNWFLVTSLLCQHSPATWIPSTFPGTISIHPQPIYRPLDMYGELRTKEPSLNDCAARCHRVDGCVHFSYWLDGGCHLQEGTTGTTVRIVRCLKPSWVKDFFISFGIWYVCCWQIRFGTCFVSTFEFNKKLLDWWNKTGRTMCAGRQSQQERHPAFGGIFTPLAFRLKNTQGIAKKR